MSFQLGKRSLFHLEGVHNDLYRVVEQAIRHTAVDFTVIEGLRLPEKQKILFDAGKTQTLNSRHLTGHAVDLAAWKDNQIFWEPLSLYEEIARAMKQAANDLGVPIEWGGDWKSFKDGVHFQLTWKDYPA